MRIQIIMAVIMMATPAMSAGKDEISNMTRAELREHRQELRYTIRTAETRIERRAARMELRFTRDVIRANRPTCGTTPERYE